MKIALIIAGALVLLGVAGMAVFVFVVQNVETPSYAVVEQDGDFELRDYPAMVVAEVRRSGDRDEALSAGFGPLARYIFAKERSGERIAMTAPVEQQRADALAPDARIAMTAPVTQSRTDDTDGWSVRFIMPAEYDLDQLPAPANADVALKRVPPRRSAVVRFSGRADDELIAEQEKRLTAWMAARGLDAAAVPVYAYYNDPFTPGFLRRNEVIVPVQSEAASE
jgi:DNA gyrase inhibitor GyrI